MSEYAISLPLYRGGLKDEVAVAAGMGHQEPPKFPTAAAGLATGAER
jgi:hypothetical protein